MSRLPALTPRQLIAALKKAGYSESRQSGSHCILEHPTRRMVIVPIHAKDIRRPLTRSIIEQTGLTEEEFLEFL